MKSSPGIKSSSIITVITYVMAAMGLLSAWLVTEVGSAFMITSAVVVLISFIVKVKVNVRSTKFKTAWNITATLLFIFFVLDYFFFTGSLLGSATRFLTILAAIKLFDLTGDRDYLIFYALIFFQIIAAAASSTSPIFLLIISIFIICAIWAMILFNIKGEFESHYPGKKNLPADLFPPSFFLATVLLTICSIVITLLIFFTIPRVGIGFMDTTKVSGIKVSGFSDKIRLGDFGALKRDTTVVMRVELPRGVPVGTALYFRGQTLDLYSNEGFEATTRKKRRIWKKSNNRFVLNNVKEKGGSMIVQKIMLEPLDTDVIFAASRVMMIEGRFETLWTNESGGVYLPNIPYSRIEYTAVSSINTRISEDVDTEIDYLATEELSGEVIKLAAEITAGAVSDTQKARKIESYLKENYSYTLSPAKGQGESPLDDFLFFTKEGYCEHFATAFVMLLRASGIGSRIVTGFLHGEWNEYGNYLLVRQQDAHSWTEANIDGYWTRFDATPSGGLSGLVKSSTFTMYMDSLRFKWRRYIIKYSLLDQFKVARSIESSTNHIGKAVREFFVSFTGIVAGRKKISFSSVFHPTSLVIIIAVLMIFAWLFLKRGARGAKASSGSTGKSPAFYRRMERLLKKRGVVRSPAETAMEFALRSRVDNVIDITRAFEGVRYGHLKLSPGELARIEEGLKRLKAS